MRHDRSHNVCIIFSLGDLIMTIDSAKSMNDQDLKASIEAFNDTGYSNDDLFKIIKTAQLPDCVWTTYTADEMIARINIICGIK